MKRIFALLFAMILIVSSFSGCSRFASSGKPDGNTDANTGGNVSNGDNVTLNVYNWGQYIAAGEDGAIDVIAAFEEKYPNIKVNYTTYDTNETMYTKLKTGGITVDQIIPSDYMIGRLIEEDMLLPLNFQNIPNYQYIDEVYKNTDYDPENKFSVPYTWGTVGLIYNTKYVDKADVTGWDLLWNEKYADKILMFGNSRDAFGIAELLLGYGINTTDEAELQAAADKLKEQRPLVQQYVMDEIYDLMCNEEAYIAPYYAGDYVMMLADNEDLAFYHPEEGFNLFIDAMCIPSCCKNKEAAELFINFLCEPEIAGGNMEWIAYGTPETAAREYIDPEVVANPAAYPSDEILARGTSFLALPQEVIQKMENLWLWAKTD